MFQNNKWWGAERMAGVLDGVDQRTQLAGQNRLELLLFTLEGKQVYGINVFKVQEVIRCPKLTQLPQSHSVVRGVANIRGKTISVIDLSLALGKGPISDMDTAFLIVSEYNRSTQGFLVSAVDRIINMHWDQILPPPKGMGAATYLTAVTNVDDSLVEIIDVEKVHSEISGESTEVSAEVVEEGRAAINVPRHVLVVDDSAVARKQITRTLDQLGIESTVANDGAEALEILLEWAQDESLPVSERLAMIISDVEMPRMDGYTLTTEIRKNPKLKELHIILHTSLSGVFNEAMVEKVGANRFIPKFKPDELAGVVLDHIKSLEQ